MWFLLIALSTLLSSLAVAAPRPIAVHPDNRHYFLWRGKPTVLVTSAEHYGAVLNLDFDGAKYLATLARDGMNQTRIFTGTMVEHWGPPWNTLNPAPGRLLAPWGRSDTPGYVDGGNKFDIDRWDPRYFTRLRTFVKEAARRGVVVEVVLFNVYYDDKNWALSPLNTANNVNGLGTRGFKGFFDVEDAPMMAAHDKLTRKIVGELKDFDNVYFELCNEPYAKHDPHLGHPWNDRIVRAIREVSKDHLIALNVANGTAKVPSIADDIAVLNFHYSAPPAAVADNWHLDRPIAFDETGFRGTGDAPYRIEAWDFMVAGGAVYSNLDWSFVAGGEQGTSTDADDKLGGGSLELRRQLGVLKRFFDGMAFVRMQPRNEVIIGGVPADASARALVEEGKQYAIYVHHSAGAGRKSREPIRTGDFSVSLQLALPKARYRVAWIEPASGKELATQMINHAGGTFTADSPRYTSDVALKIVRR